MNHPNSISVELKQKYKKYLKEIDKQFNELFNEDNNCSARYCNHETIDKHWTAFEDDINALKSYIAMTMYDLAKDGSDLAKLIREGE